MQYTSLEEAVRDLFGGARSVRSRRPAAGGDINAAEVLQLDDGTLLFMKSNRADALPAFLAEAEGLSEIAGTGTIRTPELFGTGTDGAASFLLMEYIVPGKRIRDYWETFACELAGMHRAETDFREGYGFRQDNYIGSNPQVNTPHGRWIPFFRDCRLRPQFRMAERYFGAGDRKKISYLLEHLDLLLAEPGHPSLLHGDLWAGNSVTGTDGKAWLIDPAVYYGHPEADLAMMQLFGGFPRTFFDAYREAAGDLQGYEDRRDLYNLYHLLNHLNLFGGGYLSSVQAVLRRYAV